jgi:hypothetical protein
MSNVESEGTRKPLRIYDAIVAFCDQRLVQEICSLQRLMPDHRMRGFSKKRLPCGGDEHVDADIEMPSQRDQQRFMDCWRMLQDDFVRRVEDDEFHIIGVQIGPELNRDPVPIPSAWVSGAVLDLTLASLIIDPRTFRQLRAVPGPSPARGNQGQAAPVPMESAPDQGPTDRAESGGDFTPNGAQPGRRLKLREAVIAWCDQDLISAIRAEEGPSTVQNLARMKWPCLSWVEFPRQPSHEQGGMDFVTLDGLWHLLTADFIRRMEDGEFYLTGVQQAPELMTSEQPIPGVWASACQFDFKSSVITVNGMRFGSVTASRTTPAPTPRLGPEQGVPNTAPPSIVTAEMVSSLSDEVILELLEQHADRVLRSPDAQLIEPGRISLLPIIKRKLLMRAEQGDTRETWKAEAQWLASWIESKVRSHHVPVASTIERSLRGYYSPPNRRSKPDFQ